MGITQILASFAFLGISGLLYDQEKCNLYRGATVCSTVTTDILYEYQLPGKSKNYVILVNIVHRCKKSDVSVVIESETSDGIPLMLHAEVPVYKDYIEKGNKEYLPSSLKFYGTIVDELDLSHFNATNEGGDIRTPNYVSQKKFSKLCK